ncbi:MAG: hypothetical protein L6V89_08830 [Oscillospiraceae bacterium]|nr:MAG: hypothetical protein L6V89_08830 [Oscillospiraceae bacterium]
MIVYLIPAYKPDDSMLPFIKELMQHTADIVVVNDGSGPAFDHIFASLENDGVKIISYPEITARAMLCAPALSIFSIPTPM